MYVIKKPKPPNLENSFFQKAIPVNKVATASMIRESICMLFSILIGKITATIPKMNRAL